MVIKRFKYSIEEKIHICYYLVNYDRYTNTKEYIFGRNADLYHIRYEMIL